MFLITDFNWLLNYIKFGFNKLKGPKYVKITKLIFEYYSD